MKRKNLTLSLITFISLSLAIWIIINNSSCKADNKNKITETETKHNYIPEEGYVPDEATAIKIAEAIWLPIYGEDIYNQKPYTVKLISGKVWIVQGRLPEITIGGTAYIEIQKSDCKVIRVSHGK